MADIEKLKKADELIAKLTKRMEQLEKSSGSGATSSKDQQKILKERDEVRLA